MINPDICRCCGEIWNRDNLKIIPIGEHELPLCPVCYDKSRYRISQWRKERKPFNKMQNEKVGKETNSGNIQVVIEIPKAMYEDIKNGTDGYNNYICSAIRNGMISTDDNPCDTNPFGDPRYGG